MGREVDKLLTQSIADEDKVADRAVDLYMRGLVRELESRPLIALQDYREAYRLGQESRVGRAYADLLYRQREILNGGANLSRGRGGSAQLEQTQNPAGMGRNWGER